MAIIQIETMTGLVNFEVEPGSITLVVGPNGVGKSALLQDLYRRIPVGLASYYPGHRQITFSHGWENMQMSLADLDINLFSQIDSFNRYKNVWPEEQFKSVLRLLQNSENAYNQGIIRSIEQGGDVQELVTARSGPLQIVNNVFSSARMSVQFKLTDAGLTAVRGASEYGVDRLSDGERAALFIVAAIVNQRNQLVVIIDEPERHLHPSISAPLISSAIRARPNQAFLLATHDLNLIETLNVDQVIYLKNSQVIQDKPERRLYDIRILPDTEQLSQDLKRDILGVRDKVLFVEGQNTSLDMPLYSSCFPGWKVAPRGGHDKVQEAVRALNENSSLHWMEVIGIVDGDGRDATEMSRLRESNIIVLPVPSVENLFFLPTVILEISKIYSSVDGESHSDKLISLNEKLRTFIENSLDEIICRRATWIANRRIAESKVSVADVRGGVKTTPAIDIGQIKDDEDQKYKKVLSGDLNLDSIVRLPIKATGIPAKIAEAVGAPSLKKYKQVVLHQIEINSLPGRAMKSAILNMLPILP